MAQSMRNCRVFPWESQIIARSRYFTQLWKAIKHLNTHPFTFIAPLRSLNGNSYKVLVVFDSSVRLSLIWISTSEFWLNLSKYSSKNCCSPACNICLYLKRCAMKKAICKKDVSKPFKEAQLVQLLWEHFQNFTSTLDNSP